MADLDIDEIKKKKFNISIENLIVLCSLLAAGIAGYYSMENKVDAAMQEPKPEITRSEFSLKDELLRSNVQNLQTDVEEMKEKIKEIDDKLYEIIRK